MFTGFTRETLDFFMGIRFDNSVSYYESHKELYQNHAQKEFRALCEALMPTVLAIDPSIDPRVNRSVSRLRRDTRFSKDKTLYRDHLWICFRGAGEAISESFLYYFEMSPDSYHYGCGMYAADKPRMDAFRRRVADESGAFRAIVENKALHRTYEIYGEPYKRPVMRLDEDLMPYVNCKYIGLEHKAVTDARVFQADFADEVRRAFEVAAPFYQFFRDAQRRGT